MAMKKTISTVVLVLTALSLSAPVWAESNLSGQLWTARQVDNTYIVSIRNRSSILEALTDFVTQNKIHAGQITGIGAVDEATLRFLNPETKKYVDKTFRQQMEIANLSGNISEVAGKPFLHMHVTLGTSDYTALAGHLLDAHIRGAGEFFIYPLDSHVVKMKDDDVGLNLYKLEKK
jgi:predicted DNA-binding protein with PD1-like motif